MAAFPDPSTSRFSIAPPPWKPLERALSFKPPFRAPVAEALRQLEVDRNLLEAKGFFLVHFLEIQGGLQWSSPPKTGELVLEFLGEDLWTCGTGALVTETIRATTGGSRDGVSDGRSWIDPRRLEEAR